MNTAPGIIFELERSVVPNFEKASFKIYYLPRLLVSVTKLLVSIYVIVDVRSTK